ncbi:nucleoside triphosphate pyrophosphatase [uncultured Roseobacter sp.]|uniref:Maf family protein n=1 Tax=uncultured Roseobacter sp. TaxID=114847 RepID=UPI00261BEE7F|nr:nucleoside triphosphate pyrophosphatase [uncultured Roseobacter sp.]
MSQPLILASGSEIRAQLLSQAGVRHTVLPARVDEDMVRQSLQAEDASPRDVADTLAELKARKVSEKSPGALVLGCDQVLDHEGGILSKPQTPDAAVAQLRAMRSGRHILLSAAVVCEDGKPIWRHVGQVRLYMRDASDEFIDGYVARNWDSIRHSVGAYKLEEEGVRLFTRIEGDYFNVLGLPLLELLSWLTLRGDLER